MPLGNNFDGSTPVLQANYPTNPGQHTIQIGICDGGDSIYDSAGFFRILACNDDCTSGIINLGCELRGGDNDGDGICDDDDSKISASSSTISGEPQLTKGQ